MYPAVSVAVVPPRGLPAAEVAIPAVQADTAKAQERITAMVAAALPIIAEVRRVIPWATPVTVT